jgi:regulator of sigma E protease
MHLFIPSTFGLFLAIPDPLITPLAFVFVLGVLVFVHEFGHYAVAKLCGVRVEVFSLGFGKRLWGFHHGDTDYRVSLLPLGGYVKMAGENPMEDRTGDPGEFMSHPRWQRFLVAIAGPAMNVILAIALLAGVNMVHHEYRASLREHVDVIAVTPGSSAASAGIQKGDRIVRVQDTANPNWKEVLNAAMIPRKTVDLTILRGGQTHTVQVLSQPTGPDGSGDIGLELPEAVGSLEPGGPAVLAGVHIGDVLVSLDGVVVTDISELLASLQKTKDKPVELTVLRDGHELKFQMTPRPMPVKYRVGLGPYHLDKLPFLAALDESYLECKENSVQIFRLLHSMMGDTKLVKQMSGPIGIMKITGEAARISPPMLFKIMALISVNLAIFNLLPIPILDGGLVLMLLIESVMRRDINQQVKERVYQAAFVFLILFAAMVIYNDLAKQFHG